MHFLASLTTLLVSATLPATVLAGDSATATLAGPDGAAMGTVTLSQGSGGVLVSADVTGLTAGAHGFHIHAIGSCDPDFKAAGGHYNPVGSGHGLLHSGGHHAGDLPNIHAGSGGAARAEYFATEVTFEDGAANTLFDADGSSIIIHDKPDTYGESAGAGSRVACGVISRN
ncbi:MAG: superoxide dismutase family protein [Rhodobacteraceae bacterium]|nr:superoxide dismutase family protein [Paracoccaceae bacterium]